MGLILSWRQGPRILVKTGNTVFEYRTVIVLGVGVKYWDKQG